MPRIPRNVVLPGCGGVRSQECNRGFLFSRVSMTPVIMPVALFAVLSVLGLRQVLAPYGRGGVDVADSYGQSVGDIGWLGRFGELQQTRNHHLHLRFRGAAVANYGRFDG